EPRQVMVTSDKPIPETQLQLVTRCRVPGAVRGARRDSNQRRTRRHRPVNTLMPATTSTETIAPGVGATERHPELHQATRRIPERPRPIPVQAIQQARSVTPQIILRLLTNHILIRMHNTRRLILRARPRIATSMEL